MAKGKKRSRSRSTKKSAKKSRKKSVKKVVKKVVKKKKGKRKRAAAKGPWLKKVHKAKNGATYVKNKRGQVRFLTGASKQYMAKLRAMRGKKKAKK